MKFKREVLKSCLENVSIALTESDTLNISNMVVFDGSYAYGQNNDFKSISKIKTDFTGAYPCNEFLNIVANTKPKCRVEVVEEENNMIRIRTRGLKARLNKSSEVKVGKQNVGKLKYKAIGSGFKEGIELCLLKVNETGFLYEDMIYLDKNKIFFSDNVRVAMYQSKKNVIGEKFLIKRKVCDIIKQYDFKKYCIDLNLLILNDGEGFFFVAPMSREKYHNTTGLFEFSGVKVKLPIDDIIKRHSVIGDIVEVDISDGLARFETRGTHGDIRSKIVTKSKSRLSFKVNCNHLLDYFGKFEKSRNFKIGKDRILIENSKYKYLISLIR